eukprot:tig00000383_g24680.t1
MASPEGAPLSFSYLIVGGGITAVTAAETLAHLDERSICVVSGAPVLKLVRDVKRVTKTLEDFQIQEDAADHVHIAPNVRVLATAVSSIDTAGKVVVCSDGKKIGYERLLIATGARPKLLYKSPNVIGIRDTETIERLRERIAEARRVLVVGNGGIAMELVSALEGVEVVWAVKKPFIGNKFLDEEAARFFLPFLFAEGPEAAPPPAGVALLGAETLHEGAPPDAPDEPAPPAQGEPAPPAPPRPALRGRAGPRLDGGAAGRGGRAAAEAERRARRQVRVEYSCRLERLWDSHAPDAHGDLAGEAAREGPPWRLVARLSNGHTVPCDLLVSATGVAPNTEFVAGAVERAADGGVIVDRRMRASAPGLYAAGDACTVTWTNSPLWFQMRLWSQAKQMGAFAAHCMAADAGAGGAGEDDPVLGLQFELFGHVTRFLGHKLVLLGCFKGQGMEAPVEVRTRTVPGKEYVKLVLKEGRLVGALLAGDSAADLAETLENVALSGLDVGHLGDALLDPHFELDDYFD